MPHQFDNDVIRAVLRHMNDDHSDDNVLIVRAFGDRSAVEARMLTFDGAGGTWQSRTTDGTETDLRVPWPGGEIAERAAVRREIVALYDAACAELGVTPRPHS